MKRLNLVLTLTLFWGVASAGLAQDAAAPKPPSDKQVAATKAKAEADAPTLAQLRAKIHQTMAALIEAQAAEKPDEPRIAKLTEQLRELRQKMWAGGPGVRGRRLGGWQSPWGGPGMGYGRGPDWGRGPGRGYAPAPGYRRGPAMGAGMGPGRGPGMGPGRGPRGGYRLGPAPGLGFGRSYGRGYGRGWGFVDEDRDGVCDNFEWFWGRR